jgi:hypothetical protein
MKKLLDKISCIKSCFFLSFLTVLLNCCHANTQFINRKADKENGEQILEQFYTYIKNDNLEACISLFSEEFLAVTSKQDFVTHIYENKQKLGSIKSTKLQKWETRVVEGTDPMGNFKFVYEVQYANSSTSEVFELIKIKDDSIKIISYQVISDKL